VNTQAWESARCSATWQPREVATPIKNILLITLDQFRGDSLSCAGHPVVTTPNLDRLAASGVRLARHYSQAAPCAPGRAALYTGTYQMNNRVIANGTPLDRRFDNVALAARRAGYEPALFGYTDTGIDPRDADGPDDPRLSTYEGKLPGFDHVLPLAEDALAWVEWLGTLGYDVAGGAIPLLSCENERPAEHSMSTFQTDRLLSWIDHQDGPWFAHSSYLRPHPPYCAAGHFSTMYDPAGLPEPVPAAGEDARHPLHQTMIGLKRAAAPTDDARLRHLRAQYFGMISEVDAQLGRLWDHLESTGAWNETLIIVTADHGEQLGDQGLIGKLGFFESSYHIVGIVRDPSHPATHGTVIDRFTENVDIFPTIAEALRIEVPAQCDGSSLMQLLAGEVAPMWRSAAHYEFDWSDVFIRRGLTGDELAEHHLAVLRTDAAAYVQFGDGSWRCFDLAVDPTWRTELADSARVLELAQEMLLWRSRNTDRTMTRMLLEAGGVGRMPIAAHYP
jgi:arylsulfatase A-like enzyme